MVLVEVSWWQLSQVWCCLFVCPPLNRRPSMHASEQTHLFVRGMLLFSAGISSSGISRSQ
jgi:hypothetical protein